MRKRRAENPERERSRNAAWRKKNASRFKKLTDNYRERRLPLIQKIVDEAKSAPCHDCGARFPLEVMDLDHLGQKRYKVSGMRRIAYSLETVRAEIAKCEAVCSNCHRLRTFARKAPPTPTPNKTTKTYRKLRSQVDAIKGKAGCCRCGVTNPCQLDFHHLDGKKDAVSEMVQKRRAWSIIEAEVAKCIVLCSNCHRIEHSGRIVPRTIPERPEA